VSVSYGWQANAQVVRRSFSEGGPAGHASHA
jgi:hypothetical protein